jgi:hypothetical protein
MNLTNLFGTVTAILTIVSGIMTQLLGCVTDAAGVTVCTSTLLPAKYTVIAAGAFGILTLILKAMRPGGFLHSLFGPTAVVVPPDKSGPGVVTPAQVAAK